MKAGEHNDRSDHGYEHAPDVQAAVFRMLPHVSWHNAKFALQRLRRAGQEPLRPGAARTLSASSAGPTPAT